MSNDQILKINKKSFIIVVTILLLAVLFSYTLTFLWGDGYSIIKLITAPVRLLASKDGISTIGISIFILILGGAFNAIDKNGGINTIIGLLVRKFKDRKYLLVNLVTLFFMLFGSLFGIFEESVTLLPIVIMLSLSLGFDTFTGLAMCLLAAGFGFSTALINPFSIGLGSKELGINMLNGIAFRVVIFIIMYLVLITFLRVHIKKIEKNPESSLTYENDLIKRKTMEQTINFEVDKRVLRTYVTLFILILLITILGSIFLPDLTIILIALTFLLGTYIIGFILKKGFVKTNRDFMSGVLAMAPALIMLVLAGTVKFILDDSNSTNTMIEIIRGLVVNKSNFSVVLIIYAMVLFIQFFIGSASAKIILIMPILAEVITGVISKELALLTFVFGDGYTDLLYFTNPVLLIALGIAGVSYNKWIKKTWKLQIIVLLLTVLFLFVAYKIGY